MRAPTSKPPLPRATLPLLAALAATICVGARSLGPTRAASVAPPPDTRRDRRRAPPSALPAPAQPVADGTRSAPHSTAPLDCARPVGLGARVDGEEIPISQLCARLALMGVVGAPDRTQARRTLEQLIDVTLVRMALRAERAEITTAALQEALASLRADAGAATDLLLEAQTRERMETRRLVALRHRLDVSAGEVDVEVAAGAPDVDRGQGTRVEAWLVRAPPGSDGAPLATARETAERFARAVQTDDPAQLAARLGVQRRTPFVVGAHGVEPELERAAQRLDEGQWSEAVSTRVGWVVLRSLGRVEGETLAPEVLRQRVRASLERRRFASAREELLRSLRASSHVEVLGGL